MRWRLASVHWPTGERNARSTASINGLTKNSARNRRLGSMSTYGTHRSPRITASPRRKRVGPAPGSRRTAGAGQWSRLGSLLHRARADAGSVRSPARRTGAFHDVPQDHGLRVQHTASVLSAEDDERERV